MRHFDGPGKLARPCIGMRHRGLRDPPGRWKLAYR
jgi:hypothetical protein